MIPRGSLKKGNEHQKGIMDQFTAIVVTAAGAKQVSTRDRELYEGFCVSSGIVLAVPDPSSARVGRYKYIL